MAKNDTLVLPTNPADIKAIMDGVREIDNSMTRIDAERDYIKESVAELAEKYNLPKKHLSKFVRAYHKNSLGKQISEDDDFESLVTVLVPSIAE